MNSHTFQTCFGVVAGFFSYCLGWNENIEILVWAITLDIIIGVAACFINDDMVFNSKNMYRGIVKKIVILAIVSFSHQLDLMLNTAIIGPSVTYFWVANEGLSVLENAGKCGLKLPPIIQNSLEQLQGGKKR